jgi:hypothetical protein
MEVLGLVVMVGVPGYFVLQVWLLYCLRGGWLYAAAFPLIPMAAVVAYTVHAFNKGSNLFPLVLIFTAPLAFIYLLIVFVLSRLSQNPT